MIRLADFKCGKCGKITEDLLLEDDKEYICECSGKMERLFTMRKEMQMLPHFNEHLSHEGVYIEDYGHFKKELKKRGLDGVPLKKQKNTMYFT